MSLSSTRISIQPVIISIIFFIMIVPSLGDLEGDHVCEKTEEITVKITKQVSIPYQVKTTSVCLKPPFRCTTMKTAYKIESQDQDVKTNRTIKVCCDGFREQDNACIPFDSSAQNLIAPSYRDEASHNLASPNVWIAVSLVSLIVIAVFVLILFKYKKKIHSLREEVNYVTYTVERGSSCGSSAHYAAPSEITCSAPSVISNIKSNNLVSVVNQLKSDPTKISNIEKAAALKKAIELEHDHPFACSSSASSSASSTSFSKLTEKKSLSASSPKQLFKPSANPNVYQCPEYDKDSKEPIYEELPDTPVTYDASASQATSDESELYVNDLSTSSMYDCPRAPNALNISIRTDALPSRPQSREDGADLSTPCQSPPIPHEQIPQDHKPTSQ